MPSAHFPFWSRIPVTYHTSQGGVIALQRSEFAQGGWEKGRILWWEDQKNSQTPKLPVILPNREPIRKLLAVRVRGRVAVGSARDNGCQGTRWRLEHCGGCRK